MPPKSIISTLFIQSHLPFTPISIQTPHSMSVKRPFNKIRRLERPSQEKEKDFSESGNPLPAHTKSPPNIYEALKKAVKQEQSSEEAPKPTLKPQLLKHKRDLKLPPKIMSVEQNINQQNAGQPSKATPIMIRKRALDTKHYQNVLIKQENNVDSYRDSEQAEEQQSQRNYRNGNQSVGLEESTTLPRKPNLKIKRRLKDVATVLPTDENPQVQQAIFLPDIQIALIQRLPMEYQKISFEASVCSAKIEQQQKRVRQLERLLNLQVDSYEEILSISSVTSYQIYVSKVKSGFLKNASNQSFDEKSFAQIQTTEFSCSDFTQQCPEDYNSLNPEVGTLDSFILKISPVIEELIYPSAKISAAPIFLLGLKPVFKQFVKCPFPVFLYRSQTLAADVAVLNEKLYIVEGDITAFLCVGKLAIGGLADGRLAVWNGVSCKLSYLYKLTKKVIQSNHFETPFEITDQVNAQYHSSSEIVSIVEFGKEEIATLHSNGKIVSWRIEETGKLKPHQAIELSQITHHPHLVTNCMKRRAENLFINSSLGMICWNGQEITQQLNYEGAQIVHYELPKRSLLVFVLTRDNCLRIYHQKYSIKIYQIQIEGTSCLRELIIPEIEHENRQLSILGTVYVLDSEACLHQIDLQKAHSGRQNILNNEKKTARERDVLFQGVNHVGSRIEIIQLLQSLQCLSSSYPMNINFKKGGLYLKSIIQNNRTLLSIFETQTTMIV